MLYMQIRVYECVQYNEHRNKKVSTLPRLSIIPYATTTTNFFNIISSNNNNITSVYKYKSEFRKFLRVRSAAPELMQCNHLTNEAATHASYQKLLPNRGRGR